ncbi:MAG TPA: T9SS type A sorting domain-containing protein [Bacteroidia bacterium]|jgi:hypothetical protein|nr:T9SS type A sorting domain-containing protein [Bacteroidia bacterium]
MKTKLLTLFIAFFLSCAALQAQISISLTGTNASNCSACNGTATAVPSGGTPPYTYTWSNGYTNIGSTSTTITGLCPGSYWVEVTNFIDTGNIAYITIGPYIADSLLSYPTSCSSNSGSAMVYASGGTAPYTFSWSNGATTDSISHLSTGTYTVTITDAGGCSRIDSAYIAALGLTDSIFSYPAACTNNNGSAVIHVSGGTPPYTYAWSNGATTDSISHLSTGTYSVTVTSVGGCTVTDSTTVIFNTSLGDYLSGTNPSCSLNNGTITATVYGGVSPYTYTWSNGATTATITNLSVGTYSVTVYDAAGCSLTDSLTLSNDSMSVYLAETDAFCGNPVGTAIAYPSGGSAPYTYSWSNGATTDTIHGLSAGTYSVTVTSFAGCSASASVTVNATAGIPVYAAMISGACIGNNGAACAIIYGGVQPFTYSWAPTGGTSDTALGLSAGTYIVTVTDKFGCSGSSSVTIFNTLPFTYTNIVKSDTGTCNGSITIVIPPSSYWIYRYGWYDAKDSTWKYGYTYNDTITIDSLCTGAYTVYISTDSSYCALPDGFYILGPSGIAAIQSQAFDFKVYPVPASNQVNVQMEKNDGKPCSMAIYDMLGSQVMLNEYVNMPQGSPYSIDVSRLAEGQYMLRVYNDSFTKTTPFIITR